MVLLDKVTDSEARHWYVAQAVEYGWSRAVLTHHIATNRHARVGAAPSNFPVTLAVGESDLAREIVQDPYDLDSLALDWVHRAGTGGRPGGADDGFALVGRQRSRLTTGIRQLVWAASERARAMTEPPSISSRIVSPSSAGSPCRICSS